MIHKVSTLDDAALTVTDRSGETWKGFTGEGHSYYASRAGAAPTSFSGTVVAGDAAVVGLASGTYAISGAASSTCTVATGDTTCYVANVTSGTLVIEQEDNPGTVPALRGITVRGLIIR